MKLLIPSAIVASVVILAGCSAGTPAAPAAGGSGAPSAAAASTQSAPAAGDISAAAAATATQRAELSATVDKLVACDFTKKAADPTDTTCSSAATEITIAGGILGAALTAEAAKGSVPPLVAETRDAVRASATHASQAANCYALGEFCEQGKLFQESLPTLKAKLDAWPT